MTTTEPIANSLLNRLSQEKGELRKIEIELQKIEEKRKHLAANVEAIERVLRLFEIAHGLAEPWHVSLEGKDILAMNLPQALEALARASGGVLNVVQAKRTLLESGKLKNKKTAGARIYGYVTRSENFERIAPGQYRIVEPSSKATRKLEQPPLTPPAS